MHAHVGSAAKNGALPKTGTGSLLLPLVEGMHRFPRKKSCRALRREVKRLVPIFLQEAVKLCADVSKLGDMRAKDMLVHVLSHPEFLKECGNSNAANSVHHIYMNRRRYLRSVDMAVLLCCHETIHSISIEGSTHGWEEHADINAEKYQELVSEQARLAIEWGEELQSRKMELKHLNGTCGARFGEELKRIGEDIARLRTFVPHWIVEGATQLISLGIVEEYGIHPHGWNYQKEIEVAKELRNVVGKDLFNKSFFLGDFNLLSDEYCRKTGIGKAEFYASFQPKYGYAANSPYVFKIGTKEAEETLRRLLELKENAKKISAE